MTRAEALRRVQMYSFALDDTGLFLDTHPDNRAAMTFYDDTRKNIWRLSKTTKCNSDL